MAGSILPLPMGECSAEGMPRIRDWGTGKRTRRKTSCSPTTVRGSSAIFHSPTRRLCGYWNVARGLVVADFDNDGSLDLLIATLGGKARLFRNIAPRQGHWLKIRTIDPRYNRDANGAEVRLKVDGKEKLGLIASAGSYLCSCPPIAHFGLGLTESMNPSAWTGRMATRRSFLAGAWIVPSF